MAASVSSVTKKSFLILIYSHHFQQRENVQKLIQNSLEWKLRNVASKNDVSQTPEILSFMSTEKQIHKLNIPSQ